MKRLSGRPLAWVAALLLLAPGAFGGTGLKLQENDQLE